MRAISTMCLAFTLGWLPAACDDGKTDAKADTKTTKVETKTETKTETKVETKVDAKAEDAKAEDAKVDEAKAEDAKADEKKAEDAKVDEKKADEKKAETKPKEPSKPEPEPTKADEAPKADGKDIYGKKCKSCHGATGDGKTKIGGENDIEDWTVAGWKAKWPESKIVDIVTNGKAGTKMKPFKDKLSADEILAVAKYSRTLGK